MNFGTDLLISANWKSNSYNLILDIVDRLITIIYFNLVKVTIDALGLAEVIINVIVCHIEFRNQLSQTEACYLYQNSGFCYANF